MRESADVAAKLESAFTVRYEADRSHAHHTAAALAVVSSGFADVLGVV